MLVFGDSKVQHIPGPAARVDCEACGGRDVPATTYTSEEFIRVYFIPLPVQREWHLVCGKCGADYLSRLPPEELALLESGTLAGPTLRPSYIRGTGAGCAGSGADLRSVYGGSAWCGGDVPEPPHSWMAVLARGDRTGREYRVVECVTASGGAGCRAVAETCP